MQKEHGTGGLISMSEFVVNGDMFGMYAKIPTGFSKEMHIYKIVSVFESNTYCDVPLLTTDTKETTHDKLDTVLNVIHCGIDESEVIRVALKDCEVFKKEPQECKWYKGINSVETCWGDIDIKTFNKFKRQGAKFCPYCGRKIKESKDD